MRRHDLKRVIDLEFVNGVNRPVVHTSVHQPADDKVPGLSLFIFGQYFNRHETWAEMARPWVDYMARNSLLLQQGRNVADVGYFYGEEGPLTALYGDKPVADAPKTYAYDFVNADALMDALSNDGTELVTPGGARYRALYLGGSSRRMTLATLRRIAALADGGATVVGQKPEGTPSLAGDAGEYAALVAKLWPGGEVAMVGKGRVIASNDVEASLQRIGVGPDFAFSGGQAESDIPFVHRKLSDGESYFLVNRKNHPETIEARFRVTGKAPELWDAATGKAEAVSYRIENGETIVPLSLAAEQSVHVVFRKSAVADALAIKKLVPVPLARLDGPWQVSFQPGRGAPPSATLPALQPLNENGDSRDQVFLRHRQLREGLRLTAWLEARRSAVDRPWRCGGAGRGEGQRGERRHNLACALPARYRQCPAQRPQPAGSEGRQPLGKPADRRRPTRSTEDHLHGAAHLPRGCATAPVWSDGSGRVVWPRALKERWRCISGLISALPV